MSIKIYSTFDEINKDLKILKLQREIDREQIKLDMNAFRSGVTPIAAVASTVGAIAKKAFVVKLTNKIFGIKKVKKVDKDKKLE